MLCEPCLSNQHLTVKRCCALIILGESCSECHEKTGVNLDSLNPSFSTKLIFAKQFVLELRKINSPEDAIIHSQM